jgi:hypothetical protein
MQFEESDFDESPPVMPDVPKHGVYVLPSVPKSDVRPFPKVPTHSIAPNYFGADETELNKLQYDFIRLKERFLAATNTTEKMRLLGELQKTAPILQKARDKYDMRKLRERADKLGGRRRKVRKGRRKSHKRRHGTRRVRARRATMKRI